MLGWGLVFFILGPAIAGADSAYTAASSAASSSPCASLHQLQAPPAPSAACSAFRITYSALAAYSRDALNTCEQAESSSATSKSQMSSSCGSGPVGVACLSAMSNAESKHATGAAMMQAVINRNAAPVQASFPSQGSRISSNCVTYLDEYQSFTYSLTGAIRDSIRSLETTSAGIRQKAAGATK